MDNIKYLLADFIDRFNEAEPATQEQMISQFPFEGITDKKYAAYIAAMVEELCFKNHLTIPDWVFDKKYSLKDPFFVGGLESLKAFLLVESPLSFRRRNIFVSANVLSRA